MGPTADTTTGRIEGLLAGDVAVFLGVPYARAPAGAHRFAAPEPPASWSACRPATRFGPAPPQTGRFSGVPGLAVDETGEDCLSLNVWTPGVDAGARPVMVWIPGGAFTAGSASQAIYDGGSLARRGDVVIVTVNYRLGALGFLSLAGLDTDLPWTANAGLLDQVAALRWVGDNIAAFGGDPGSVTIFGESAGGMSVATLLGLPAAHGLFRRAIAQSGATGHEASSDEAGALTELLLSNLGLAARDADQLGTVPLERLLDAQERCWTEYARQRRGLAFRPIVDGEVLPRSPLDAVAGGAAAGVPLLIGTTADEWRLFGVADPGSFELDEAGLTKRLGMTIGDEAATVLATYRASRPSASPADLWFAIETDQAFRVGATRLAEAQSGQQSQVFMYRFTWRSPIDLLGACHAIDIPFVFGTLDTPGMPEFAGSSPAAHRLSAQVQEAWLAFARTGRPHHAGIGDWPSYDAERRLTKVLGDPCDVVSAPDETERRAWDRIIRSAADSRATAAP